MPSYDEERAVLVEYCHYWDCVLIRNEDSCKQIPPGTTIGQIKSTDRTLRVSVGPKVKCTKSRFHQSQNRKVVISTNLETILEVMKYDNGDEDTSKKKVRGEASTTKNHNKRNQVN